MRRSWGIAALVLVVVAGCNRGSDSPDELTEAEVRANKQPACSLLSKDDVAAAFPELKATIGTPVSAGTAGGIEALCEVTPSAGEDADGLNKSLQIIWSFDESVGIDFCEDKKRPDLGPEGCEIDKVEGEDRAVELWAVKGGLRYTVGLNTLGAAPDDVPADVITKLEKLLKTLLSHAKD